MKNSVAQPERLTKSRFLVDELSKIDWSNYSNGNLLTRQQVEQLFGVSGMTVFDWRKKKYFPVKIISGQSRNPPVRFDEGEVRHWAKVSGREVFND